MSDKKFQQIQDLLENLRLSYLPEAAYRSLSRVTQHIKDKSIGIISANRYERNATENRAKSKELEQDIRNAGYGFIRAKGGWLEMGNDGVSRPATEPSYIVVGKPNENPEHLEKFLTTHGSKYDQDAIVLKKNNRDYVQTIETSDRNKKKKRGTVTNIGTYHPGKFGTYFTALHGDAHTDKKRSEMTPEERQAHKEASLKQKTFVIQRTDKKKRSEMTPQERQALQQARKRKETLTPKPKPKVIFAVEHCVFEFSDDE